MSRGRSFTSIAMSVARATAADVRRRETEIRRLERESMRQTQGTS